MAATALDIPVAHIQGGQSPFGHWDDAYGYGITKLSSLHFPATESYRQRIIGFGEHPDRVFNVGSLAIEPLLSRPIPEKKRFQEQMHLDRPFLFVALHPHASLGSENQKLAACLTGALSHKALDQFDFLVLKPEDKGLGRIINQELDAFICQHPDRSREVAHLSPEMVSGAMAHCRAMVGNRSLALVEGATLKTPVVNIGQRLQGREKAAHVVEAPLSSRKIVSAVEKAVSPTFRTTLDTLISPFEKPDTPGRIVTLLKGFTRADTTAKAYYLH
jgi:UDP-N-acetylglucosamine 2-epimerase (non-hydrolysing)/GDP/UDP-N,N'-diacetylbacillosamine 2-epimerase (hydrolysing)